MGKWGRVGGWFSSPQHREEPTHTISRPSERGPELAKSPASLGWLTKLSELGRSGRWGGCGHETLQAPPLTERHTFSRGHFLAGHPPATPPPPPRTMRA